MSTNTMKICAGKRCVGLNTPATFEHGSYPVCDHCAFRSARAEPETDPPTRLPTSDDALLEAERDRAVNAEIALDELIAKHQAVVEAFARREFSRLSHERRCQFVQQKGTTYTTLSKRLPEAVVKRMVKLAEDWVVDELTPKMGEVKGKVQG